VLSFAVDKQLLAQQVLSFAVDKQLLAQHVLATHGVGWRQRLLTLGHDSHVLSLLGTEPPVDIPSQAARYGRVTVAVHAVALLANAQCHMDVAPCAQVLLDARQVCMCNSAHCNHARWPESRLLDCR
jgi:hypothetical protein